MNTEERISVVAIRRKEQLKDRRDYRQALIQKREEIESKIVSVELQIKKLNDVESNATS